jgi:ADP-ribose pyrophosphatase YjhB (NUDIX family)
VATQKSAYVDVNPVIVTSDGKIVLAKRVKGIVGGGKWHLPGGRVQVKETFEGALKRVTLAKTNLKVELLYPSLKESMVGIYDDPERDPREHVVSIAFLCKIVAGETKPGTKVDEAKSFSEEEIKRVDIAFDHKKTVKDAFSLLRGQKLCYEKRSSNDLHSRGLDFYMSSAKYFRSKSLNMNPDPMLTRNDSKLSM